MKLQDIDNTARYRLNLPLPSAVLKSDKDPTTTGVISILAEKKAYSAGPTKSSSATTTATVKPKAFLTTATSSLTHAEEGAQPIATNTTDEATSLSGQRQSRSHSGQRKRSRSFSKPSNPPSSGYHPPPYNAAASDNAYPPHAGYDHGAYSGHEYYPPHEGHNYDHYEGEYNESYGGTAPRGGQYEHKRRSGYGGRGRGGRGGGYGRGAPHYEGQYERR